MADEPQELPDRLSLDPRSPFFDSDVLEQGIGIRFNGQEKTNVQEYCVSEGWIRIAAGRSRDRYGNPMTIMLKGKVEPYVEGSGDASDQADQPEGGAGDESEG
jgi:hypothetical protein